MFLVHTPEHTLRYALQRDCTLYSVQASEPVERVDRLQCSPHHLQTLAARTCWRGSIFAYASLSYASLCPIAIYADLIFLPQITRVSNKLIRIEILSILL